MISVEKKVIHDIFGIRRHFQIWCEGDDSLVWLTGLKFTALELKRLEDRWKMLGHRPKLFLREKGDEAEFCGWKVMVDAFRLTVDTAMPDLPRMMQNCFYTTARDAIEASKSGQSHAFARAVTPGIVARAGSIATSVPSIANWMLTYVEALGESDLLAGELSRDDIFRLGRDDLIDEVLPEQWKGTDETLGHYATNVRLLDTCTKYGDFVMNVKETISNSIAQDGMRREAELAVQHGWVRSRKNGGSA